MNKFSQKSTIGKVRKSILDNQLIKKGDRIVVAVSGGADSVSLLSILSVLKDDLRFSLAACHYNHRLRGEESDRDEKFVKDICAKEGIALSLGHAPQPNLYKNEEMARDARYGFFEKILREGSGDKVATAHNLNDSAETLLMRLIRGTGLRGIGAIPPSRGGKIIRPLLSIGRTEIIQYLGENKLLFRTDRTNFDKSITRNRLRLDLIPYLSDYNPNIVETLGNCSKQFQEDYAFMEEIALDELKNLQVADEKGQLVLENQKWQKLPPALQRLVLRKAIERFDGLNDLTIKQLDEVCQILKKGTGKKYKNLSPSLRIELVNGKIIIRQSA